MVGRMRACFSDSCNIDCSFFGTVFSFFDTLLLRTVSAHRNWVETWTGTWWLFLSCCVLLPRSSHDDHHPQQDEKCQHLDRCPNGMPAGKAVQLCAQVRFVIRCILDAQHDWRSPGSGEGVQNTQEGGKG